MKIILRADKTIKELNRELAAEFPFLRFGFFRSPHAVKEGSPAKDEIPPCTQLIEITGILRETPVEINGNNLVCEVEQRFREFTGLPVQVFRRQGNIWIETTRTDLLSMDQQNHMGREAMKSPQLLPVPEMD